MASKWTFKAQPGIFVELADIAHEYPGEKVTTQPNLGLIPDQKYPSDDPDAADQRDWVRLAAYVRWLNENSSDNVAYKVLYLTRHGLGVHNKMHAQVGSEAWNVCTTISSNTQSFTNMSRQESPSKMGTAKKPGLTPFSPKSVKNKLKISTPSGPISSKIKAHHNLRSSTQVL
jgi:hypothetical protein